MNFYTRRQNTFSRPPSESFLIEQPHLKHPSVILRRQAFLKMKALISACSIEISWMGLCGKTETGDFEITDVLVPQQVCSATTTDMTVDGVALLMEEMIQEGRAKEIGMLKCWGHSHVNMGVFASGTDETQTDEFLARQNKFFIRLIGNKRGEMSCHVYIMQKEGRVHTILHHPDIVVEEAAENVEEDDMIEWAEQQMEAKLVKPKRRRSWWSTVEEVEETPQQTTALSTIVLSEIGGKYTTGEGMETETELTKLLNKDLTGAPAQPKKVLEGE